MGIVYLYALTLGATDDFIDRSAWIRMRFQLQFYG